MSSFQDSVNIANVQSLKILGVNFDKKLFEEHLRATAANASQKLGLIRKSSTIFRSTSVNLICFRSFILPLLEYCSPVWISSAAQHLKLLDSVASRARYFFSDCGRFNLDHRSLVSCLCMLYKFFFSENHPLSGAIPPIAVHRKPTRASLVAHEFNLTNVRCSTEQFKRSFIPFSVSVWNDLPSHCFGGSLVEFKKLVNKHLLSIYS